MSRSDYESSDLAGAARCAEGAPSAHSGTFPSCPEDDYPTRWEVELDGAADGKDDPMFDALRLLADDNERLARLAYGDATVDAALARIAEEEGL